MISHWLAWISFGCSILLLLKYAARISRIKKLNRTFSRLHRPLAVMMLATGMVHGILSLVKSPEDLTANLTGLLLSGCALYISLTCWRRKKHIRIWMKRHRYGSAVMVVLLVAHVVFAITV